MEATIEVRRGWLGLPGAEVVDPFTGSRFELTGELSPVRGDRTTSVRVSSRFARRGLHRLPPPALTVRDPLELSRAEAIGARRQPAGPRPAANRAGALAGAGATAAGCGCPTATPAPRRWPPSTSTGYAPTARGLRPAGSTGPRWRAGAGLIERRLQSDGDARPLVVLDARTPASDGRAGVELLDAAVRAAASLVLEFAPRRRVRAAAARRAARRPKIDRELHLVAGGVRAARGRRGRQLTPSARAGLDDGPRRGDDLRGRVAGGAPRRRARARPGGGPTMLVVPEADLVGGHPRGVRGAARPDADGDAAARASCSAPAAATSARVREDRVA